jgi:cell pole-organizing protein PopZ
MVMSASPMSPSISQTAEQRAHEPSMEEILASIRKIIADDQMLPLTRQATPPRPASRSIEPIADHPAPDEAGAAPEADEPTAAPSTAHTMSDFEAAFAELRPSFAAPPSLPTDEAKAPAAAPMPETDQPATDQPIVDQAPVAPASVGRVEPIRAAPVEETALVSPATGASVSSAFNALATTMFLQNTGMVEEAMRDMLRPMLKQWLDDNLPTVVERLVRAEIERVARGGR